MLIQFSPSSISLEFVVQPYQDIHRDTLTVCFEEDSKLKKAITNRIDVVKLQD